MSICCLTTVEKKETIMKVLILSHLIGRNGQISGSHSEIFEGSVTELKNKLDVWSSSGSEYIPH